MCFDKTGTLTEDKMEVKNIFTFRKEGYKDITQKSPD